MPTEAAERRRRPDRGRHKESGQSRAELPASHPRPAVTGEEMARRRVHQLEKDKLELTSIHNQEVSRLQAQLARLRSDVERGEAQRQTLEYQLVVRRREAERDAEKRERLTARAAELQQSAADLQKALDITRQAREEDQHALQQEVEERDRLVQSVSSENERLHQLLQEQEEALEVLDRRIVELEKEREKEAEAVKQQANDLKYLMEKDERSRAERELSDQRLKSLESNIEAERAAHLESKFNSEIIQLRIRDLEAAVAVERSGHQEALSSLELIRGQFRELERAYSLEREKTSGTEHTLERLQKEYQQCKSDLDVALETERKATSDLTHRLEENRRQHANTCSLLEQANQRLSHREEDYMSCMKQIRETLQQHINSAKHDGNQNHSAVVLELLKTTLSSYQHRLDTTTKQVQDLLFASERLDEENQKLRQLISDQQRQTEEAELLSITLKEEVMCLRQESSDRSTQNLSLRAELQTAQLALEREREEREREREEREKEKEEREREVQRITDHYQEESKARLSFLYCLYQRLLAGCVLLDQSQCILGTFSWVELCDVITEQADQLTSDLRKANDKLAHLQSVCERKSVCVRELQRSQECVLSRLEESVRRREEAWNDQHTHTVTQLQDELQLCRSQRDSLQDHVSSLERHRSSLTSDLSRLQGLLTQSRGESASFLSACALLAGALTHTYRRTHTLSAQKTLLSRRLAEREALEEEVRRLASALGGEEEEEGGGSRRRAVMRWRRSVCVVLAVRRWCVLARRSTVLFRLEQGGGGQAVCVCVDGESATESRKGHDAPTTDKDDDEGRGEVCVRWLRSKHLSSVILSSMAELQGALAHTGPSPPEVMSAARSGLSRLLKNVLDQSESVSSLSPYRNTLASRLEQGLHTQPGLKALVSTLQQHFLVFSQRLHSAEVERRGLRLEVANLKRAAKGELGRRREDPCSLVPAERFDSVCVELRQALSREQQAQALVEEQSDELHTLKLRLHTHTADETHTQHTLSLTAQSLSQARQEVSRKERSLRILGKHLSGVQRERRELEDRLRQAEEDLREATRCKESVVNYMKAAESSCKEVRDSLIQSRHSLSAQLRPLHLPRVHLEQSGAERIMGGSELAVCQRLLSTFSELYQATSSRIGWLEQEVSAHHSHVTALRGELQDACLRDNLAFVPISVPRSAALQAASSKEVKGQRSPQPDR
ncbi:coiled-coil domain-containing protein 171 [Diretmus argenteus]